MRPAARRCAGWATALTVAALMLTACGSTAKHVKFPVSKLCVDVGLPTSGTGSSVGRAMLAGLEQAIPATGRDVDGYQIRLCDVGYRAGSSPAAATAALLNNASHAASTRDTIAYVGVLPGPDADALSAVADVLGHAAIPLITPSGPDPSATGAGDVLGSTATPAVDHTTFYLLPSIATQAAAVRDVTIAHSCGVIRHHRETCEVLSATQTTLCSEIGVVAAARPARYCVLAGPDLSRFDPPATAYGASAGALLEDTFAEVGARGGDIADRGTVLRRLIREDFRQSVIGPISFDSGGAIRANHFTVYTVEQNGRLVNLETFLAH